MGLRFCLTSTVPKITPNEEAWKKFVVIMWAKISLTMGKKYIVSFCRIFSREIMASMSVPMAQFPPHFWQTQMTSSMSECTSNTISHAAQWYHWMWIVRNLEIHPDVDYINVMAVITSNFHTRVECKSCLFMQFDWLLKYCETISESVKGDVIKHKLW